MEKRKKVNSKHILLAVFSLVISYLICVFISNEPNINNWYAEGRAVYLIYSMIMYYLIKNWYKC